MSIKQIDEWRVSLEIFPNGSGELLFEYFVEQFGSFGAFINFEYGNRDARYEYSRINSKEDVIQCIMSCTLQIYHKQFDAPDIDENSMPMA